MYFFIISRFFHQHVFGFVNKGIDIQLEFEYLRYKKDFLDENPKTMFLDMKKLKKATQKF